MGEKQEAGWGVENRIRHKRECIVPKIEKIKCDQSEHKWERMNEGYYT